MDTSSDNITTKTTISICSGLEIGTLVHGLGLGLANQVHDFRAGQILVHGQIRLQRLQSLQ